MSILDQFKLDGKVALVTGASRGLGQAMAVGLAEAGADIAGLASSKDVSETRAKVEATGRRFMQVECDLGSASVEDLNKIVGNVVSELGSVDILINNAGIIRRAPALEFGEEDWNMVMQININAMFFLSQAAARHMVEKGGGKIINIASMLSYQGGILVPAYTSAKSAVMGLTRALANEWAPKNINVNAIAPGYMATANTQPLRDDKERNASIVARIPAGDWGAPEDMQGIAVFLASDASSYMHGATVPVDGAWLAR